MNTDRYLPFRCSILRAMKASAFCAAVLRHAAGSSQGDGAQRRHAIVEINHDIHVSPIL
ncbi:MAG: hypothetical protein IID51_02630 [Proteobacteria bacterium]|nr:hypothetical protein [Pseudomonadota bacterium]